MWNNKKKAITFSFDDGVLQDKRLIEILDKYGLKATFNLNSGKFGLKESLIRSEVLVRHDMVEAEEVRELYKNHEVALHGLNHKTCVLLDDDTLIKEIEEDRKNLEVLMGEVIVGMAYPHGSTNEHVINILQKYTKVKYARTTISTYNFDLQNQLLAFNPTVHFIEPCLFELGEKFLSMKTDKPQLFYVWGHAFDLDSPYIPWGKFEEFCKMISNQDDVFYGTNKEVLL